MIAALCIAGLASSVGKTTVTLALAAAFRRRGLRVRCAKVGPDFIDPGFHEAVTGMPGATLDGWLLDPEALEAAFARAGHGADLVLVEGMMGLFDGLDGSRDAGSTAEVARRLGVPVLLVVDAAAQVRSAAAVVLGAERFDPRLDLAGVVLNRVGGTRHAGWVRDAVAAACRTPVVGALPWREALRLPERHLGLVTARERRLPARLVAALADLAEARIDLDACRRRAGSRVRPAAPPGPRPPRVRLGVALDDAFQFYYPDALDALRAAGAELVPWSPLGDARLPEVDGLYLGGGYPELHAARLAANRGIREGVRALVAAGRPVYAECGGLMYLARELEDPEGRVHAMAGVLPVRVTMRPRRLTIGYRAVELAADTLVGPAGARLRGHEFHASRLDGATAAETVYRVSDPAGGEPWADGYRVGSCLASYVHLHFGACPGAAAALVGACARRRARAG